MLPGRGLAKTVKAVQVRALERLATRRPEFAFNAFVLMFTPRVPGGADVDVNDVSEAGREIIKWILCLKRVRHL